MSPDAAQQTGAVDETMPDPAAAAGESAPDSQKDQSEAGAPPPGETIDLGEVWAVMPDLDVERVGHGIAAVQARLLQHLRKHHGA